MIRLTPLFVLALLLVGCSTPPERSFPTAPTPLPAPDATAPTLQTLSIGEELKGTFDGSELTYQLTVLSDGTLNLRLTWDPHVGPSRRTQREADADDWRMRGA